MSVQFPAIRPSDRELTPAALPQTRVRTESRRTSRRASANDAGGATVTFTFTNITDAWAESLRQAHSLSKGTYDSLVLPPELWAGDPELEAFLAGNGDWRFSKPPAIEWQKRGRCTATVELIQKRRDALPGFNPDAPPLLPWVPPEVPDPGPVDPLPDEPDIPDTWPGYYLIHGPSVAADPGPGSRGEVSYPWHVHPVADGFICAYNWEKETPDGTQLIPHVSVIKYSPEGAILWEQTVVRAPGNSHDAFDVRIPGPATYTLSDGRLLMICGGYLLTIMPTGANLQILGKTIPSQQLLRSAVSGYVYFSNYTASIDTITKQTEALVDVWSYGYYNSAAPSRYPFYDAIVDAQGYVYTCGITYITNTQQANWRVSVVKLDPDGAVLWGKQYNLPGTPSRQEACGCVLLNNGNLFVAGSYIGGSYYKSFVFIVAPDGALVSSSLLDRPTSWPDGGVTAYGISIDKGPNGDVYLKLEEYGGLMESTNAVAVVVFAPDGLTVRWSLSCSLTDILDNGYSNYFYPYGGRSAITDTTLYLQGFGYATTSLEFYSYCSCTIVLPLDGLPDAAVSLYDETRGQYKLIKQAGYFLTPTLLAATAITIVKDPVSVTPGAADLAPSTASSPYDICPQIGPDSRPWTMAWISIVQVENANTFYETTYTVSSRDGDSTATSYPLSIDTGLGAQGSVNSGNLFQQIYAIPVDEVSMLVVPAPKLRYRNDQTPDLSAFYTVFSDVGTNFTNLWTMTKYAFLSTRNNCIEVPITQALADGLWAWGDRRWLGLTAGSPNPLDPFMDYGDPSIYSLVPTVTWRPVTETGSAFNDVQLASATDPEAWFTFVNAGPPRNLLVGEAQPATGPEWVRSSVSVGNGYIANRHVADGGVNNSFRPAVVTTLSRDWRPQLLAQFGVALP